MSSFIFASNTTDVNITNNLPTNLTNYEVKLTLDQTNVSESFDWDNSGNDIRIITTDNQYLNFWIEDFNSTSKIANIWVKIPLLEASSTYKIKVKYNQGAQNLSNGDNTFIFFDDFSEDSTIPYSPTGLENADANLNIPTYDGSGQNVHPSLVYFEEPFNGWKYWMAFTPYANSNKQLENPSIVVSNDGLNWQEPEEITNPIDPFPGGSWYNSDPSLFYDGNKFILYYREMNDSGSQEYTRYRDSNNGINWSDEQTVLTSTTGKLISPTVIKKDDLYYMWLVSTVGGCSSVDSNLVRYTSTDGITWGDATVSNLPLSDNLKLWHPDIKFIPEFNEYWMIFSASTGNCNDSITYFAKSQDGLNWQTFSKKAIDKKSGAWDNRSIYKSTFLYDASSNKLRVWYSASSTTSIWNTGYTEEDYNLFLKRLDLTGDLVKWNVHKYGSQNASVVIDNGEISLTGVTDVNSSANIQTLKSFKNNIILEIKQKVSNANYANTGFGNGNFCTSDFGTNMWFSTLACQGYNWAWFGASNQLRLWKVITSGSANRVNLLLPATGATYSLPSTTNYYKHKLILKSDANVLWDIANQIRATSITLDTEYINTDKYLMLSQGKHSTGAGGTRTIDYVFVRNYASTEPTVTYEVSDDTISISNISLIPSLDITYFGAYKATAEISNLNSENVKLFVSAINGEGNDCWDYLVDGSCLNNTPSEYTMDYNSQSGKYEFNNIYPDTIYPEMVFGDSNTYWNTVHLDEPMWRQNYHLFKINNSFSMDSNMSFWIEFNTVPTNANNSSDLLVYLVGKGEALSYFQSDWRSKPNTELLGTISRNQNFHHQHSVNSLHHLLKITTNADGTIGSKNLDINNGEFFIVLYQDSTNLNRGWQLKYLSSDICQNINRWFTANRSGGNTWNLPVYKNDCPDFHIHVSRRNNINDGTKLEIKVLDQEDIVADNNASFYFSELPNLAPNQTSFITPVINSKYSENILVSWNPSTDPNNDTVTYDINYINESLESVSLISGTTDTNFTWDISSIGDGNYTLVGLACDQEPLCTYFDLNGLIEINRAAPATSLTDISIYSSNDNNTLAKPADTVTLFIQSLEELSDLNVIFNAGGVLVDNPLTIIKIPDTNNYEISFIVGLENTDGEIDFIISAENLDREYFETTDDSFVIIDPTINTYTVLFKDWNGEVLKTEDVNYGGSATAPADPIRTGYTFNGWDVAFNNIISDLNITAQYTINTYTVLFKDWNGEVLKNEDVNYGGNATAPANPTRTGYTFSGWDVSFNNIVSDLNVTAQYTINTYTVNFKDWNGEVLNTENVNYGGSAPAPANPTRTGYTFNGWSPSDFTNITADTNITAQYTINNGGGSSGGSRIITSLQSPPVIVQPQVIEIININENLNYSIQEKKEALEENDINLIDQEILSREEVETTRKTKAEINSTTGNLNVILNIKNKTNKQKSVSVVEIIPKEIADHIDKINFKIQPTEIINPDPIVLWKLNLSPNQDVNLEYSVDNITDVNLLNDYNSIIQNWMTPIVTAKIEIITPIKEIKECVDVDDDPCTVSVLIDDECVIRKICKEEVLKEEITVKSKFNYEPIVFLVIVFLTILVLLKITKKETVALYYNKKSKKRK